MQSAKIFKTSFGPNGFGHFYFGYFALARFANFFIRIGRSAFPFFSESSGQFNDNYLQLFVKTSAII
jgi:hypothetical protein